MTREWTEERRTCFAYSPGGHFAELSRAIQGISFTNSFHVTFPSKRPMSNGEKPVYFVTHPRRSVFRALRNCVESLKIILRERPKIVISTGADVAVPTFVIGKLFGATTIFVETGGSLRPTLAGRLCYPFASLFIVQWPDRLAAFPRAKLARGLLL